MKEVLRFLKIIADDTRLKIIDMLSHHDMCVCEIMHRLNMSQPAVSHHLRVLKKEKIVLDDKDGRWVFYSLNKEAFFNQVEHLNTDLFNSMRENLRCRTTTRDYEACKRIENTLCSQKTAR